MRKLTNFILASILLISCSTSDENDSPTVAKEITKFALAVNLSPSEGGSVSPDKGQYDKGSKVSVTASPNAEFIFVGWTGSAVGSENPISLTMDANKNLTAVFEKRVYALTVTIEGEGTVDESIIQAGKSTDYDSGTVVELIANPGEDYMFVRWSGDHEGTDNPLQLNMDEEKHITAVFEKRQYALNISIEGQGAVAETIVQSGKSTDYVSGTVVELTANPGIGQRFVSWSGDYEGAENPIQLTIDKETNITAVFAEGFANAVAVDFEIEEGGHLEIRNTDTQETLRLNTSSILSFEAGSELEILAIPNDDYQFDGWSGIVGDRLQLIDQINITAGGGSLKGFFVPKDLGNRIRRTSFFDETVLDYRGSEHFMVWWDKEWDHNHDAKDVLKWAEYTYDYGITNGMEPPIGSETHYINIYVHHKGNEGDGIDILPDGWGQGVGTDEYSMPYYTAPGHLERHVVIETRPTTGSVMHEIFHIMQYKAGNHYNTFSYEDPDNRWYVESTASAFEDVRTTPKDWYSDYNIIPSFTMQPQISLWGPEPEVKTFSRNGRQYAGVLFFMYAYWNELIPEGFLAESFYSGYDKSPQEYMYENLSDFKGIFRQFARDITVLHNIPDQPKEDIKQIQEWWRLYAIHYGNEHQGVNDDNSYSLELTDAGSSGYFSPVEKNMAWSHTVIKVNNTTASSYNIDFIGDSVGDEGTASDFYVATIIAIDEAYTFSTIPITNHKGITTLDVPSNATLYLVVVSTPEKFNGDEEFDYQLKIDKL